MVGATPQNTARATTALLNVFSLFRACTEVAANLRYEAVHNVIDGGIIVFQSGKIVRFAEINTSELTLDDQLHELLAREASSTLLSLISGQVVGDWVSMARKRYRLLMNHPFMLEHCG